MKANSKLAPLLLLSACHLTAGPFVPPGAHRCDSDAQCDEHHVCRFPSAGLSPDTLQSAVGAIQKKEADLLAGRDVTDLSVDEQTQFHALISTEQAIVSKLLTQPQKNNFLTREAAEYQIRAMRAVREVVESATGGPQQPGLFDARARAAGEDR